MERKLISNSKLVTKYDCPICLNLCVQPVTTPCNHFFCFECEKQIVLSGMSCPMCRSKFDRTWTPEVNLKLQSHIKHAMSSQFLQREVSLRKLGMWVGQTKLLRFTYGNTYQHIEDGDFVYPNTLSQLRYEHSWTIFMILHEDKSKTDTYIKSVTYKIPKTNHTESEKEFLDD